MERTQQRSLQSLVLAACEETFGRYFKHLQPLRQAIEQMEGIVATVTIVNDNYDKQQVTYEMHNDSLYAGVVRAYRKGMARTLSKFHSQTKYIRFEYYRTSAPECVVVFKLTKLRSRNVLCTAMIKGDVKMAKYSHKFTVVETFPIGQLVSDGPVTVKAPWYIRMLSWLAMKLARPSPTETWK